MKYVSPSVSLTAFNCPHCGALAKQDWAEIYICTRTEESPLPDLLHKDDRGRFIAQITDDEEEFKKGMISWFDAMAAGEISVDSSQNTAYLKKYIRNLNTSHCFNCYGVSLWHYDKLIHPVVGNVVPANPDMPSDIKRDYDEASSILNQSPRGAAALLRLAIQKLCKELGQPGKNINDDIKSLVSSGLSSMVQQALDTVRVIGNSAVHPGQIDIKDDRQTAESLFRLINLIVEKMVSEPKHVQAMYDALPGNLVQAIKDRDGK
ncbi:DUF4145 domain-containing protein [Pseudomonas protegens]|uniref:DUF4145 domain-containing protein n=1 Tax=Pseudomonas protegens TaxID=380021 RepID=UPI001D16A5B7|nr:DUF4145 domain-containing protein [Pseudomonas protegens]